MLDGERFPLGLGTSRLRSVNGGLSAPAAARLLQRAFDQGIRFIDTAPSYGQGDAERAIGSLPGEVRDRLFVCSKIGYGYGRKAIAVRALKPLLRRLARSGSAARSLAHSSRRGLERSGSISVAIRPGEIRASLSRTLGRLRRERLDLLLLHEPDADSLHDENVSALEALRAEGLIRAWGVATADPLVACKAADLPHVGALQVPVRPEWIRRAGALFDRCARRDLAIVANGVMAPGATPPDATASSIDAEAGIRARFEFALRQECVCMVLCGTTSERHLDDNIRLMHIAWKQTKRERDSHDLGTREAGSGRS
jgi:aryl-alcohol dehydrogenase-like predicted oxidoreductase